MDIIDIRHIWFDLGYTLLYLKREEAYQQALKELDIDMDLDRIEKGFHFMDKLFMREYPGCLGNKPSYYMPWYIGRLNYYLGVKLDINEIYGKWMDIRVEMPRQWHPFSFVEKTLRDLNQKGYKLGVISNWDGSARPLLDYYNLTSLFSTIIISSEVGIEKPAPGIFETALDTAGALASESLYVGDNYYDDAVGSRKVGMQSLIINRFDTFGVDELTDCQIIPDISYLSEITGKIACC